MPINVKHYNISCYLNNTGYGVMSRNIIKALCDCGLTISLYPKNRIDPAAFDDYSFFANLLKQSSYNKYAISLNIDHQYNLFHHTTSHRVGFTVFELDTFTKQEKESIVSNDITIVPTKWAKTVIANNIPDYDNVHVANLGVDTSVFNHQVKATPTNIYRKNPNTFVVYFGGKYEHRKSVDENIAAFNEAFDYSDDVELWLSITNPFLTESQMNEVNHHILNPSFNKMWAKTKLIPWKKTQKDIAEVMSQTSCGLFLAKAEGWNLEALEMLVMKKPVILSDYSGHTEFNSGCYNVDCPDLIPAVDNKWFFGQGNWVNIAPQQITQAAYHLKTLYNDRQANVPDVSSFSWQNTAIQIIEAINSHYA